LSCRRTLSPDATVAWQGTWALKTEPEPQI
jgi:hypothetical protein